MNVTPAVAVARLAEQSSRQCGAFLQQLVKDAAEILGGGPVATLKRIAKPGLARELFDERAADPVRALNEVALGGRVDVDARRRERAAGAVRPGLAAGLPAPDRHVLAAPRAQAR
jgi:hypothetical protein